MALTVLEVIRKSAEFFTGKGVESPRLNAELITGHVLALNRMKLYLEFERPLSDSDLGRIREMVRRRAKREPLQYVLGETDFSGLKLRVDRRALIPRPETELLVELTVARAGTPARILDLGTGSGAIALALARAFSEASVTAVDRSAEALVLARENAASTGMDGRVSFIESNWFEHIASQSFDLIAANPPYLSTAEAAEADPEVKDHEPMQALTSGEDGFTDLGRILEGAPRFLAKGGLLALETGIAHRESLEKAAGAAGFSRFESSKDLTGRDRFFFAWR